MNLDIKEILVTLEGNTEKLYMGIYYSKQFKRVFIRLSEKNRGLFSVPSDAIRIIDDPILRDESPNLIVIHDEPFDVMRDESAPAT